MAQYVFTMNRVGKIVPPKRHILKNISLSFFPGAMLMLAVFTFNLLGDALRDIFDPRRRT